MKRIFSKIASRALLALFICGTVGYWLRHCWLSPDSTNYLTAAANLLEHGRLFVFTNWPDTSLVPAPTLYKLQPFGFPFYLAAFIFLFRDPFLAAVFAQSFAIILFFWGVWRIMELAQLKMWLRVSLLLIITSSHSFGTVFAHLWTETLFMGLTAHLLASTYSYGELGGKKKDLAAAALLLFFTSSIRFIGIFNLGFFIPALLKRKLTLKSFASLITLALLPNLIWHLRNKLIDGTNFESHYDWQFTDAWIQKAYNIGNSFKYSLAYDRSWIFVVLILLLFALAWGHRREAKTAPHQPSMALAPTIFAGAAAQLLGLTAIALFSGIGNLIRPDSEQARLLVPVCFLIFLWIHTAVNVLPKKAYRVGLILLLAMMGNLHYYSFRSRLKFSPTINYPSEYVLWRHLQTLEPVRRASHFYTDENFIHQVFSGKVQRMIWAGAEEFGREDLNKNRARISQLLNVGDHPFFLFKENSANLIKILEDQKDALKLTRLDPPGSSFRIYFSSRP